ncbi:MAG: hypothetical protein CMC93_06585 [Flavobacteriaceae bacterium]|nr:hypothetical protein [Flavobacteriaceae bacterium]|tara:strand:- start:364 stop:1398 length:1035 start_codon:yes stop_codon:yes gene_type:complete
MNLIKNTILSTMAFLLSFTAYAQEEEVPEPTFAISGSIDTYYRSSEYAPFTSFANLNGFALGMANVIMSYEGEKSGFVADFVFGNRGNDAVFGSADGSTPIVNQLYAYYNLSDGLTITLGNFNTFLGYEVISPAANFNYSTSYMFSYGPFSHTGIKADIAVSDNVSLMLGVFNETDSTEYQAASGADNVFGAQLGLFGQYINFISGGAANQTQIDFTGGFDITDSFFFGINATSYSSDGGDFSGVAVYPQYSFSDSFALGVRFESFTDDNYGAIGTYVNGVPVGIGAGTGEFDNSSFTLTGSFTSGNFMFKPEFRVDTASDKILFDGADTDSISSFVVAAIYSF